MQMKLVPVKIRSTVLYGREKKDFHSPASDVV
jgi:hypothetical protein